MEAHKKIIIYCRQRGEKNLRSGPTVNYIRKAEVQLRETEFLAPAAVLPKVEP